MVERIRAFGGRGPSALWVVMAVGGLLAACGQSKNSSLAAPPGQGGSATSGGSGGDSGTGGDATGGGKGGSGGKGGAASGGSTNAGGEGGAVEPPDCSPRPAGLVRLSLLQVKQSVGALLGAAAAETITADLGIEDAEHQTLPALNSSREGTVVTDSLFSLLDHVAQAAGTYVFDNLASVTGCGDEPTDDCARAFVRDFASRAFRRAPDDADLVNVLRVYDDARSADLGASVAEAVQYGVYAVFESPFFVYRTELGAEGDAAETVLLTPHELANEVSFFLTGGPPDAELILAAEADALSASELAAHVDRLLASDVARTRLAAAVFANFGLANVESVVLDGTLFPLWGDSLRASMLGEARRFLGATLFTRPVPELLTTKTSFINAELAAVYGVTLPAGVPLDADGFAEATLGAERSGLLTLGATMARLSRPDRASVILRGHWVNTAIACQESPVFPEDQTPSDPFVPPADATEREKAALRAQDPLCRDCHTLIDPYGIVLDALDAVGAYRPADEKGVPTIAPVTLPALFGSQVVSGPAELGAVLAADDRFVACLSHAFLRDALTVMAGTLATDGCEVTEVVSAYRAGSDPSFAGLARAIALSPALRERARTP